MTRLREATQGEQHKGLTRGQRCDRLGSTQQRGTHDSSRNDRRGNRRCTGMPSGQSAGDPSIPNESETTGRNPRETRGTVRSEQAATRPTKSKLRRNPLRGSVRGSARILTMPAIYRKTRLAWIRWVQSTQRIPNGGAVSTVRELMRMGRIHRQGVKLDGLTRGHRWAIV